MVGENLTFFLIVFIKLRLIMPQSYKMNIIFYYLGMFQAQFYIILKLKLIIYNLPKILNINSKK